MKGNALIVPLVALLIGLGGGYLIGHGASSGDRDAGAGAGGSGKAGGPSGLASGGLPGAGAGDPDGSEAGGAPSADGAAGDLLARAVKHLEAGDVETALDEILGTPGQMERMDALLRFVRLLDGAGVQAALSRVREMPRGMDMFMTANLLLSHYGDINPTDALDYLSGRSGMERGMGTASILRSWASKDPAAAADYFASNVLDAGGEQWQIDRTASSLASEWARQDSQAALAWAKGLPEPVREEALESVLEQITTEDPGRAAEVAMALPEESRSDALQSVADQWARTDPEAATRWAASLEGEARAGALEEALQSWAYDDPAGATAYLEGISDAGEKDGLLPDVASRWARRGAESAAEAAEWLVAQDDGEGKARAMGQVIGSWVGSDPTAASTWLGEQPAGAVKDSGIVALIESRQVREDPATAVAWAGSIAEPELRSSQVFNSSRRWLSSDRDSAVGFIEGSGDLSADQKTQLLSLTEEELRRSSGRRRFDRF